LGIALGFALLLSREFGAQKFLQVLVLLPWAIPQVSSALAWKWIFDNNFGVMNAILRSLHIIQTNQAWTGTELSAMMVILISFVWVELPLPTLIFLAALQTIPKDMYEAAEIDGAKAFARFRYVTFKWLKPVLFIALIYESIMDVRAFDPVFVITQGAPGGTTSFISYFTYRTFFNYLEFGQASSYSIQVSIIMVALILIYFRALRLGTLRLKV